MTDPAHAGPDHTYANLLIAVSTAHSNLAASFTTREAGGSGGVYVDIGVAFQDRFQGTREITGRNALACRVGGSTAGANNISWSERARNGSGSSGWTSWLAVAAAQEDHYSTRHVLGGEVKMRH